MISMLLASSLFSCVFDSDDKNSPEEEIDSGTYSITLAESNITTYPTGGALIPIYFSPGEVFTGDVELEFVGPSYMHHQFLRSELTFEDSTSDVLLWADSTATLETVSCYVVHSFSDSQDSLEIVVDVWESPKYPGRDYGIKRKNEFSQWFDTQDYDVTLTDLNFWCDYSFYPEDMIGGAGWVFVSDNWILRMWWSITPLVPWYQLRKRGDNEPTCIAKEVNGVFTEETEFPPDNR